MVLRKCKITYKLISASDVRQGGLNEFKVLIMSGGYTTNYLPGLNPKGCKSIRNFLNLRNGRYLGICAGAYVAATPELGISNSIMIRKSGIYTCEIQIPNLNHPVYKGQKSSTQTVYYQNGPHIQTHPDEKSLALYEDGTAATIETKNALIYSWHPEKLNGTHHILLDSIQYLLD